MTQSKQKNSFWRTLASSVYDRLATPGLFRVIIGLFLFQAVWIAVSGAYSMAFDEYYHFGLIQLHAQQLLPFFTHQPPGDAIYGAVARDPSYMYHFLLSIPYRLFAHFVHAFMAQIVFLRLLNVGLFAIGLVVFRRLFRLAGLSERLNNVVLLFLTLLPVAPFMAAQINYDNMFFALTGLAALLALRLTNQIREKDHIPLGTLMWLLAVCALVSLVKYAALPVMLGVLIYLGLSMRREVTQHQLKIGAALAKGVPSLRSTSGVFACLAVLVLAGLFVERYGVNMVRYHTPVPDCGQVLSEPACSAYDPYGRNQTYIQQNLAAGLTTQDKLTYPELWVRGMMRSLFFTVSNREQLYAMGDPLPLAYTAGYVMLAYGIMLLAWRLKHLWRSSHAMQLFMVMIVVYVATLYAQNFKDYLDLGVPVARQGRYLMPILPLAFALVAVSARDLLRLLPRTLARYGIGIVAVLFLLMLEGGGFLPFILRSADEWMWQNSVSVQMNRVARNVLWRTVVH